MFRYTYGFDEKYSSTPIHDAFIVEEDNAKHAKYVMKSLFKSRYKFDIS